MEGKAANEWTCEPREHDFTEIVRYRLDEGLSEPAGIYCKRCGWIREFPKPDAAKA